MKKITALLLVALISPGALAHEGHGHEGAEAPHGGIIQEGKKLNLELVTQGSEIMLYPIAKDGKAMPLKNVQLNASSQAPKKKKAKVDLQPSSDHFKGKVDAKGSYRYELEVEAKSGGSQDKFNFQVEPQG